jgi:hypothetical protein
MIKSVEDLRILLWDIDGISDTELLIRTLYEL